MQVAVIVNASAGGVRFQPQLVLAERLRATLHAHGWETEPRWVAPDGIGAAVADAVAAQPDLVLIGGGDGSLNAAANVLAGSPVALGVLPLGTFNHLARDLGMPHDLDGAVAALVAGEDRMIDLGEVNGRYFINNCSLGLYPAAVRRREVFRQQLGLPKPAAMSYALLGALRRLPRLSMSLSTDAGEDPIALKAPFLFIGNNRYRLTNPRVGQRESLDAGMLHVAYVQRPRVLGLLRLCLASLTAQTGEMPDLVQLECSRLRLRGRPRRLKIAVDGEVMTVHLPITVRLHPGALKVRQPCV